MAFFICEYSLNIKQKFAGFKLDEWKSTNPQNFSKNSEKILTKPDGSDMLRFDTRFDSAFYDKKQIKNKKINQQIYMCLYMEFVC